ncbi:MAG: type II toxin-antitoxin system VapC family toxin [Micrococcales bacterium]|nr:type II toxin-antitoxin system VapC family toxin [Micrococcales bacterium]
MIVVDTNVWSETLRPDPDGRVLGWMAAHALDVYMAVTTVHELRYGVALLPDGHRKTVVEKQVEQMLADLHPRVLAYDCDAARAHAHLRAEARRAGHEPAAEDGQIAAIAKVAGASVATRNTSDFADLGIEIINPWDNRAVAQLEAMGYQVTLQRTG